MVEAILVATVLVIALGSAGYLHHLFAQKMRATREARAGAWQRALEGCGKASGAADAIWRSKDNDGLEDIDTTSSPSFLAVSQTSASRSTEGVQAPESLGGGKSPVMSSSQQVACNDKLEAESDEIWSKMDEALGMLKQGLVP